MKHVKNFYSKLQKTALALMITIIVLAVTIFNASDLHAQSANTKNNVQQNLKMFEGYYRFTGDENAFLQITAKGDSLILKQLWDGKELSFHQTAALEFYCDAQSFPLKFTDSAGSITQVLAFNKDLWNKVKNYHPTVHKEIQLTSTQLQALTGEYKMQGGDADDVLQISYKGNNLILKQLWDGQEISFTPESPLDFYCADKLFPIKFSKNQQGVVTQVLAFNRDVWIKIK